ncbi:MAG: glycosyltransferase family 4 protein, partial [Hyphomicrobiales bacterium]|nr:glycosyltransferase family 4 protein [Hyphomicrobiales bacterium]
MNGHDGGDPMHILFLTDNFPPEVNAPASRTYEHAREWVKQGRSVTVITCAPNFPAGKVYDGYTNKLWQREVMDGITVVRVWSYITANDGFVRRTLDYVSYMLAAIIAAPFVARADVVVATSPQFFTAVAGYVTSRMKRAPFVFELRDLWPDSIKAVGAMSDGFVVGALTRLEMMLYRKAAAIISVTHSFRQTLIDRGIDGNKIHVVTNGVDATRFKPMARDGELEIELDLSGKLVVGYVGTHGMAHALETLLDAAHLLQQSGRDDIHVVLLGDGARKSALMRRAHELQLANVSFIETVPKTDVPRYWSLIDMAVIHLKRSELFETVIPSKLFECMGMGIPVVHGVAGESAKIVAKEGCGVVFQPEDAEALCAEIVRLAADPALRKRLSQGSAQAAGRYDRARL